jgi:hypothetical protein
MRIAFLLFATLFFGIQADAVDPRAVPLLQAIPQAYDQVSFERGGLEITRYHFGAALKRPFLFHSSALREDPSHGWVTREIRKHTAITTLSGLPTIQSQGRASGKTAAQRAIAHVRMLRIDDTDESSFIEVENAWRDKDGATVMARVSANSRHAPAER